MPVGASEPGNPVSSAEVHPVGVLAGKRPILIGPCDRNRVWEKTRRKAMAGPFAAGASERTRERSRQGAGGS